ncbi:mannosyltransferase B [Rhodopirellula maiorica SM1]|uniref:Mannosyltransferase B n=1 Tax=Rhodopirellula maiorica SM1 TaxID=1265738 RepID=M5RXD1_9BACT|nr:glycosyltransferase family 1 protein [Rhodopirellula maiorica]EMI20067.1 mannosyltransferase B [Rhodopirellula maiorica SM1]
MKVWIDGSAFENPRQLGIWRVFYEIMSRTSREVDYTLWLRSKPMQPLPEGVRVYRDPGRSEIPRHHLFARLQRRLALRRDPAELARADLYHPTGLTLPINRGTKCIATIHDMIAESHFPIGIRELQEAIPIKQTTLERAKLLVCVSQTTASELSRFYPELKHKTRVIHHGAEHLLPTDSIPPTSASTAKNALFIGQRTGYKNFPCLLDAMQSAHWPSDAQLNVVGPRFSSAEELLIRSLNLTNRIRNLGHLSTEQLRNEYRTSRCLVFPSFQEGFGLPCLESQSLGCPLVCSDIAVFHEVAGEAALFFDPRLGEQLAEQVKRVGDPAVRKQLIENGRENVHRFSWDKTATQILEVYHQATSAT